LATIDIKEKAQWKPLGKSLADEYEYVMYGKVYKYDDSNQSKITIYASFGGLLMCLSGDYRALAKIEVGQYLYLLIRK
jgi:DNA-directed RNA polymerase I, II, and III subunit RPABC3